MLIKSTNQIQSNGYRLNVEESKYLRESNPEFHEFAVKTEISDFFISGQEKPFGDLFTNFQRVFVFEKFGKTREMPYLLRSRH